MDHHPKPKTAYCDCICQLLRAEFCRKLGTQCNFSPVENKTSSKGLISLMQLSSVSSANVPAKTSGSWVVANSPATSSNDLVDELYLGIVPVALGGAIGI